jgi:3-oxoadipate enol-lactonase
MANKMALFDVGQGEVYYELSEPESQAPTLIMVNGLTQATRLWAWYVDHFHKAGYRILTYDLLGQGGSSKPALYLDFNDHCKHLDMLMAHLDIEDAYVAGVSFGGILAMRFAIDYPGRIRGLIPMSCMSEFDTRMWWIGESLHRGMIEIGFEYLQKMLMPLNVSSEWIEANEANMPTILRMGYSTNDLYAIQNLMESLMNFEGFTDELHTIKKPVMIMNGEFDYFTPRNYHEQMRREMPNCRLVLIQKGCHAFTLEMPDITSRMIQHFMEQVESGQWQGDQSVWIATDDASSAEAWFECPGDHTRAIPLPVAGAGKKATGQATRSKGQSTSGVKK